MVEIMKENGVLISETDEKFKQFMADERFMHLVVMFMPPELGLMKGAMKGVMDCAASIEHRYLNPSALRAKLFSMRVLDWEDVTWFIISVPLEDKDFVKNTSRAHGFKITDGTPVIIGEGAQSFPVNNKRVFTLENDESYMQAYKNDPMMDKALSTFKRDISSDKIH
jgi:hypothetical protein